MSDSLTERRLKAGLDALAANLTQHGVPTVDTVRAILAASDRALAVAGSEEVLRKAVKAATDAGACKDHSVLGSGHMEYASSCTKCIAIKLRAARPLLVAPERAEVERRHEQAQAEIARLRKELAFARTMAPPNAFGAHTMAGLLSDAEEHKRELATLRQEHERVREELAAELEEERSWSCDGCGTGFSRPSKEPCPVCTLRQRLAEVTDLMRRVDAALNLGGWYESAIVEHGSSWHLSLDEHLIFEQATMDLDDFLAAAPQAPEGV